MDVGVGWYSLYSIVKISKKALSLSIPFMLFRRFAIKPEMYLLSSLTVLSNGSSLAAVSATF